MLERALKLKAISSISAECMPMAEMKHDLDALIERGTPMVFLVTRKCQFEKMVGNVEEIRSCGGAAIAVVIEGDDHIKRLGRSALGNTARRADWNSSHERWRSVLPSPDSMQFPC